MPIRGILWALIAALCAGVPAAERGQGAVAVVEKGPAIDGTLADPAWAQAAVLELGVVNGSDAAKYKTTVRVLHDGARLYVGFECAEPETGSLKKDAASRDGEIWADDCVEAFLFPDPDTGYKHIGLNAGGAILDQHCKGGQDKAWNGNVEAKVAVEEGRWIATFAVPLKDLDAYAGEGLTWKANFTRSRPKRGADEIQEYSWAVLPSTSFHQPDAFGLLSGFKIAAAEGGVTRKREPVEWSPKEAVNLGEEKGGVTVYQKFTFEDGPGAFSAPKEIELSTVEGLAGKSLSLKRTQAGGGFGASLDFKIGDPADLKLAYHAKARGVAEANLNAMEKTANDNSTSRGPRWLSETEWRPVLYYFEHFNYNSKPIGPKSRPRKDALFTNIRWHGEAKGATDTWMLVDNFVIYRGKDTQPPGKPDGLKAEAGAEGVALSWTPAEDNVAVMCYVVSRASGDGPFVKIAETPGARFDDAHPLKGKLRYRVLACDFDENLGDWSGTASCESSVEKAYEPSVEEKERENYRAQVLEIYKRGREKGVAADTVVCYGDSLTGATSYPLQVEGAIGIRKIAAYGYAGMKTGFGKENAEKNLAKDNPYLAFILYGTNNSKKDDAIAAGMQDMEALAQIAIERGTIPVLGTIPPRGFNDPESKPEANYNRALIELCTKLKIPCGHLFEEYQKHPKREDLIAKDGVHNTTAGMAASGRGWKRAFDQIHWVLRDRP